MFLSLSLCKKTLHSETPNDTLHSGPPINSHSGPPIKLHSGPPNKLHSGPPNKLHSGPPNKLHSGPTNKLHSGPPNNQLQNSAFRESPIKPLEIPLAPVEENINRMEIWLLQQFSNTTFNTDRDPLPVMEGKPHHIHLKPDHISYACQTPANVALHWETEVKKQLDKDEQSHIIEKVPQGEPTEWCARMVVVPKKWQSEAHS